MHDDQASLREEVAELRKKIEADRKVTEAGLVMAIETLSVLRQIVAAGVIERQGPEKHVVAEKLDTALAKVIKALEINSDVR